MSAYAGTAILNQPYDAAMEAVRAAPDGRGFGVLTVVEAFDHDAMMGLADNEALHSVAPDAKQRLNAAFAALNEEN